MTLLDTINSREALCALNDAQLRQLCDEIRQFLVLNVARTGGHLASNLGVVELSVALERVFDTSRDRLLFDVGHQSYVHKILTGRRIVRSDGPVVMLTGTVYSGKRLLMQHAAQ